MTAGSKCDSENKVSSLQFVKISFIPLDHVFKNVERITVSSVSKDFFACDFLFRRTMCPVEFLNGFQAQPLCFQNPNAQKRNLLIWGEFMPVRGLFGPFLTVEAVSSCRLSSSVTGYFSCFVTAVPASNICEICL